MNGEDEEGMRLWMDGWNAAIVCVWQTMDNCSLDIYYIYFFPAFLINFFFTESSLFAWFWSTEIM